MVENVMEKRPRLHALDGLRGLCAIAIMVYHFFSWNGTEFYQVGSFGVYLFYVISGFSMWYVYAPQPVTSMGLRSFFIARFARIVPLYFLASLAVVAAKLIFMGPDSVFSWEFLNRFLLNVTMLFGVADPGHYSHIPGGWSIGIEAVFYLFFPLFLLFTRDLRVLAVLLVVSGMLNQLLVHTVFADHTLITGWSLYTQFPVFLVYFIAGILTAELYERLRLRPETITRLAPVTRWLALAAVAFIFFYPAPSVETFLAGWHFPLLILAAMAAIFSAAITQSRPMEGRFYSFLGDISYSTYLMHFFVYNLFDVLFAHFYPGRSIGLLMTLGGVTTLGFAWLLYRYFESPARSWINRRFGHRAG